MIDGEAVAGDDNGVHFFSVRLSMQRSPRSIAIAMTAFILKHASASRSSGTWSDEGYDVLAEGAVVGRLLKAMAVSGG